MLAFSWGLGGLRELQEAGITYLSTSSRSEGVVAERRIFFLHALQGWSGREPRFLRTSVRPYVRAAGRRPAVPPFPKNIKTCANVSNRLK